MSRPTIGIRLESLGLPLRQGLAAVNRLGVSGVQFDALGDLSPRQLSQTGRRELLHLLRSYNVELTALGCPLRRGLDVAEDLQPRLEYVREVMRLSFDLGPRVAIVQSGRTPDADEEKSGAVRPRLLAEALTELGAHGDRTGVVLALETGLESGAELRDYLNRFDTGGLGVNFDPANLLINGFDVYESLRALHGKIRHTHAKDARISGASRIASEVPVGHGDIDWLRYLAVLQEVDYQGWLTIERESGDDRLGDVSAGVAFLRRLVG